MIVQEVVRKGSEHKTYCQDSIFTEQAGRYFIGAVFDGCSGGSDSHFASSLFKKILNNILLDGYSVSGNTIEDKAKSFMKKFVERLIEAKKTIQLEDQDLLATFMMIIYDKVHGECLTMTIGDGVICKDGEVTILENERFKFVEPEKYMDMPDYIAYDLMELQLDPGYFDIWFDRHVELKRHDNPSDISISTDGILTFNAPMVDVDPVDFLLIDKRFENHEIMLPKKVNILASKHKTVHKDDIGIVRIIIPETKDNDNSSNQEG